MSNAVIDHFFFITLNFNDLSTETPIQHIHFENNGDILDVGKKETVIIQLEFIELLVAIAEHIIMKSLIM